jgi:3-deoxy-D-manno-octulosonate 8-phosphate phosphatase (KDO 8-P phosphatase)
MDVEKLNQKLCKIKLLVMDVDGTLTNATVYYSKNGEELKKFSIRDGMGIELLRKGGLEAAILTSESSPIVTSRARKLQIQHVIMGSRNKKKDIEDLAEKLSLKLENIAYIGDDVNDIEPMRVAGISACPADSNAHVRQIADYVCERQGGDGAVREIIEKILISQNISIILPESW